MEETTSERRPKSRRHSRNSRSKSIIWVSMVSGLLFFVVLYLGIQLGVAIKERDDLLFVESKQARELDILQPQIEQLKAEIAKLTNSRLPNLKELKFDEVIAINQDYVRNIGFTLAKKNNVKRYEYRMVMDNRGLTAIHPNMKLLFFDRVGIQIGSSEIGVDKDGVLTLDILERGEIQTRSSVIELSVDADPVYFMIRIIEPKFD